MIARQNTNYAAVTISCPGKAVLLNVSGDFLDEYFIPIALDNSIENFAKCNLNILSNIILGAGAFQNIAATSVVPIYIDLTYHINQGPLTGKWIVGGAQDNVPPAIPPAPAPPYSGLDPLLQTAQTIVPNIGFNVFQVNNFELKNRRCYREEPYAGESLEAGVLTEEDGFLIIEDASKLLFHAGFFVVAPNFIAGDARKVLGAGVTDTDINNLFSLTTLTINYLPALRS